MERLERQLAELAERLEKAGPRVYSTETAPAKTWRNLITGAPSGLARRYAVAATPPGREIVETYRLPKGQLEALTKLMVLPDVPIRVRPRDGAIEVHGTRADHDRFKAFIGLLSDEKSVEAYRLPPGKLKALTALMALDDVPVMVQPGSKEIKVQGSPAVQAVFKAFVQMIHPEKDGRGGAPRGPRALEGALRRGLDAGETARRAYGRALAGRTGASGRSYERATRLKAKDLKKRAQAEMRRATRDLSKHTKDLERQAERLEAEADRLEDRAERAREKANNLREKMRRTGKPDKADRLGSEADAFEAQADELEAQAEVLLAKAEAVQDKVEAIEEQAEEVTEQIEERVERELEAIEEAIEAAEEDADDDHDDDADDDDDDDDDEDDDGSCRSP